MASTLLIIQLILTILVVIVVLLQKSASMGLGAYSGSNESMFGSKGPANFLVKATFVLGGLFVINTIALGYTYNSERTKSVIDSLNTNTLVPQAPLTMTPTNAPQAPTTVTAVAPTAAPITSAPAAPATN